MISGDKRVFDEIDLPVGKKLYQQFVPEKDFLPLMKTFDIAIAPLANEYDKRRSHIKVLEYMALKIPWVCTDYPTYSDLRDYGITTNNSPEEWEEKLCYMVDNLEERKEYANGDPYNFALSQSYDNNIGKTLELYQFLIDKPYRGYIPD
jgi:glycosyltransferase involved in cell wall biosynthesis